MNLMMIDCTVFYRCILVRCVLCVVFRAVAPRVRFFLNKTLYLLSRLSRLQRGHRLLMRPLHRLLH